MGSQKTQSEQEESHMELLSKLSTFGLALESAKREASDLETMEKLREADQLQTELRGVLTSIDLDEQSETIQQIEEEA